MQMTNDQVHGIGQGSVFACGRQNNAMAQRGTEEV